MINVRIEPGRVTAVGHAGYSREGSDIVCAAVSILLYTLAASVDRPTVIRLEPGDAEIVWETDPAESEGSSMAPAPTAVAFFETGVRLVAARYPECVVVRS